MSAFTIGADPELFFRGKSGNLVSVIGKLGGSKDAPLPISEDGHAILEDNVAAEFNIPPSDNAEDFVRHLCFTLDHLKQRASELGLEFAENVASASFPESELATPAAFVFGCEPDFNAWTEKINPKPRASDPNLRSCGGHIHIGTDLDPIQVVRACDLFISVPALFIDKDARRRELYGKAGAFRFKEYGVEYRTPSNFWIWDESLMKWVYSQVGKALDFVAQGNQIPEEHGEWIQQAINCGDTDAAKRLATAYPSI